MEETGRNSAAGGSTERPASSGRGIVDKALVKEALGELLQLSGSSQREEGQRRARAGTTGLASTSANAATAVDTTRTTTATVTQARGGKSVAMARPWE